MSANLATVDLTADQARRLTERIRLTAMSARESIEKLQALVTQAQDGNAHLVLGYQSWTAYLADTLGDQPLRLPRDQRQELVGYLAGEGMSTRAIAPIVGVHDTTVQRDLSGAANAAPEPPVNTDTGEVSDDYQPEPEPRKVTGLDGKTYTRPEPAAPSQPKRRAITDQFFDAAYDMRKAVEKVARITEDDRFPQNVEKVAARHRNDLIRTQDLLTQVIESLHTEESTNV